MTTELFNYQICQHSDKNLTVYSRDKGRIVKEVRRTFALRLCSYMSPPGLANRIQIIDMCAEEV